MTPFAQHIIRNYMKGTKHRHLYQIGKLDLAEQLLDDVHCYEVSEVIKLGIEMLVAKNDKSELFSSKHRISEQSNKKLKSINELTYFLPSSRTWIEWNEEHEGKKAKEGVLLTVIKGEDGIDRYWGIGAMEGQKELSMFVTKKKNPHSFQIWSKDKGTLVDIKDVENGDGGEINMQIFEVAFSHFLFVISASLLMINSPKIIAKDKKPFHVGLRKDLSKYILPSKKKIVCNEWHIVKLEVFKDGKERGESNDENKTLRGKMAYHYVRNFTRIRLGKLEFVREHFRGDIAVGTAKSYYNVTPGVPTESINILDYL